MANQESAKLENLVALTLLKYIHFRIDTAGEKWDLFYFRDKEKREVDFVVEKNKKPFWFIEVKTKKESTSPSLQYLKNKFPETSGLQITLEEQNAELIKQIHHLSFREFCEKYIHYN